MVLGKTICLICGTEFQKRSKVHKFCCDECRKIANREQDRVKRLRKNPFKGDFVLDMETWTWKKIVQDT